MEATQSDAPQFAKLLEPSHRKIPVWATVILVAIGLWKIFPAHSSIWWHLSHGNHISWQNTRLQLPYAWRATGPPAYPPGGIILERRPWLPFTSTPHVNTLFLDPPSPARWRSRVYSNWRDSASRMPWGPVSEFSRTISTRTFHCLSQPAPMHGLLYRRLDNVHANCQEQSSGWEIVYWGAPQFLDESLQFLGKGEALPTPTPGP